MNDSILWNKFDQFRLTLICLAISFSALLTIFLVSGSLFISSANSFSSPTAKQLWPSKIRILLIYLFKPLTVYNYCTSIVNCFKEGILSPSAIMFKD